MTLRVLDPRQAPQGDAMRMAAALPSLNGAVVGCAAGLVARALSDGDDEMRFRDTASLGIIGSLAGSA